MAYTRKNEIRQTGTEHLKRWIELSENGIGKTITSWVAKVG